MKRRRHLAPVARRDAIYGALNAASEIIWENGSFTDAEGDLLDAIAQWSAGVGRTMPRHEHEHAEQLARHLRAEAEQWGERFEVMQRPPVAP